MRELNIDWAALLSAFQMNMPEVRCFLCIDDGRVLKLPPGDPSLEVVLAEPHRYFEIEAIPSRIQYQWLDEFIKKITDEDIRARMEAAINGKGAFRRFKDILLTLPDERRRWFEYRDQMMRQRILDWVREHGIVAINEAPWDALQESMANAEIQKPTPIGRLTPALVHSSTDIQPTHAHYPPSAYTTAPTAIGGATVTHMRMHGNAAPVLNHQHEVEALRDFLIEWADTSLPEDVVLSPIKLEELAFKIAKRFALRSLHH